MCGQDYLITPAVPENTFILILIDDCWWLMIMYLFEQNELIFCFIPLVDLLLIPEKLIDSHQVFNSTSHHISKMHSLSLFLLQKDALLCLVLVHVFKHSFIISVKSLFVIVESLKVLLQMADVGFQPRLNVRGGGRLSLKQVPLGLQHFVLLLQKSYLWHRKKVQTTSNKSLNGA